ncbi:MAG TPA: heavy-metal-associated domain-containing protein, partial [Vicinamibacterales bacterium]|nr:heavy-metal-associated domain-containing protein [Vicinamibacterales bacterium]
MAACETCELHAESVFRVEGMDCHEEVAILERRLGRLPGLEHVEADVVTRRLRVKHDAARLSASRIAEAVAETGMRAWLEHEEPLLPPASLRARQVLVAISGVALGAAVVAWAI